MENFCVKSVLEVISKNLDGIISIVGNKSLSIYGMDEYSFAIQSLLRNRNSTTQYYVLDDPINVIEEQRRLSGMSVRYCKSNNMIEIKHLNDFLHEKEVLLVASRISKDTLNRLEEIGLKKGIDYFLLYDWSKDDFSNFVQGKKKLTLKEIQSIEKDILKEFDSYCEKQGLKYWVCGGTLLGTLRHKGFIPWDDDIDVFMPWEDYKKFIQSYTDNDVYKVASMEKVCYLDKCKCYWTKMIEEKTISREDAGLLQEIHPAWIDIFPIIGLPEEEKERKVYFKQAVEFNRRFTEAFYRNNGNIKKRNAIYYEYKKMFEKYDFNTSTYVGIIGTQYGERDCTTRAVYNDTIRMPFEDIEVNVPIGYKEYLDNLYGTNWMEIPEESKRHTHDLEAYWL